MGYASRSMGSDLLSFSIQLLRLVRRLFGLPPMLLVTLKCDCAFPHLSPPLVCELLEATTWVLITSTVPDAEEACDQRLSNES